MKKAFSSPSNPLRYAAWAYVFSTLMSLAMLGWGIYALDVFFLAMGGLGLVMVGAFAPVTLLPSKSSGGAPTEIAALREELRTLADAFEHMAREQALSDDARRVLNRKRERELLCKAIEEDMSAQDWDAALVLVKELAESFGYRADAEEFRTRIETSRYEHLERRVLAAIRGLDQLIADRRWDKADQEAARISRLYPDSPRVDGLRHRVHQAREAYKQDLERRFLHAAREERLDDAMDLLKEMDAYLSESEGQRLQEVARGVIGKARENLGAQFKLAVHDRRWRHAAEIGGRIIEEFPNTRMAEEVRGLIDGIRAKAGAYPG
ncbi:MAG: hypothetical protein KF866_03145 [Phycisphaeraceae bacterium]|nr:hypothetical protein [Phycisphaeraceae bacterium]MCW5753307.1 hypothetical protein [Phycisphaeraceae bacterium]